MAALKPPYPTIKEELFAGRVIPFLGAGASLNPNAGRWSKESVDCPPTAGELAGHLAYKATFPVDEPRQLTTVAQYYRSVAVGPDKLKLELQDIFARDYPLTPLHELLASVDAALLVVTTNYDDLIERAFDDVRRRYVLVVHPVDAEYGDQLLWWPDSESEPTKVVANKLDIDLTAVSAIYKMHGTVDRRGGDRGQYVITEDDYVDFLTRMTRKRAIPAVFAQPFRTRPFLFLGYGLRDWNFRVVLNGMARDLRRPNFKSWAIDIDPSPLEVRFWQDRGVEIYRQSLEEFVEQLAAA